MPSWRVHQDYFPLQECGLALDELATKEEQLKSFTEICRRLGAPLHTPYSWCALSPDRKRAIFTMWQDCFIKRRYPMTHKEDRETNPNPNRPGWVELQSVVEHCLANPGTEMLGVLCKAEDPSADPRKREWVDDRELMVLSIERDDTGEVWATITERKKT